MEKPLGVGEWPRNPVIYQVYVPSFNGTDGKMGDLAGITKRLDHVQELGVDALWLTPFYCSEMKDGGYDVSNPRDVDPRFGVLSDFDRLIANAHEQGIRVIIDLVANHTSVEHDFFQKALKSKENPKHGYYVFRPPGPDGGPPNDLSSRFGGSAWQSVEVDEEPLYYLHTFGSYQPDLNWSNPKVREYMKGVMRFWIDRGVDGFRADAVNYIAGDDPRPVFDPKLISYIKEMISVFDEYQDRDLRMVLEATLPEADLRKLDSIDPRVNTFNFPGLDLVETWKAPLLQKHLNGYYSQLPEGARASHVGANHDRPHLASLIGAQAARAWIAIYGMLPGDLYIYNGQELGRHNLLIPPELRQDKGRTDLLDGSELISAGLRRNLAGRDGSRTPMPWDDSKNAGFSSWKGNLWLPVDPTRKWTSVEAQRRDPRSPLALHKRVIGLRKTAVIRNGTYDGLHTDCREEVLTFAIRHGDAQRIVAANLSGAEVKFRISGAQQACGNIILSSVMDHHSEFERVDLGAGITLRANEAVIIR